MNNSICMPLVLALGIAIGAHSVNAQILAEAGQSPEGFVALLTAEGEVIFQVGNESFESLFNSSSLSDDENVVKAAIIAASEEEYPYLYPDGEWQLVLFEEEVPSWYTQDSEAALMKAFEEWKGEVYSIFDPSVLLSLENPQLIEVSEADVTEEVQAWLNKWADIDTNWMVCYVRNAVPTTISGAVGKSLADDAWNYAVNMIWTQTGEDLAGHSQVDLIAALVGSAFPGIKQWEGYFGSEESYPFAEGANLLKAGFLYSNGLFSARQVKEFDDNYAPGQYKDLSVLAQVQVSDTGKAFACVIDEAGTVFWETGTDYVSGLLEKNGLDRADVVCLNVGPKEEKGGQSVGTTYNTLGWEDLGDGYFTTLEWEDADAEKPAFAAADGTVTWRMKEDGSVEPASEDRSEPGAPINPGKYTYVDGDITWEVMAAGNGTARLTKITPEDLAKQAEQEAENAGKERQTYFNTPAPMTEVKSVGPVPSWYDERKEEIDELARKAYADWQDGILEMIDVEALNQTLKGMDLDHPSELTDEIMENFRTWVGIWMKDAIAGSINIEISTLGYKKVGPTLWNEMDNTVLANYKSMDHEGCPGPTTSTFIAAYALEAYGKVIDAATDDYMGSTMNDVYSAHVGSFIKDLLPDEDGGYVYQVAHDLWESGCIPFYDGEYWYLVSGPDFDPDGNPAVEVIFSGTTEEILG